MRCTLPDFLTKIGKTIPNRRDALPGRLYPFLIMSSAIFPSSLSMVKTFARNISSRGFREKIKIEKLCLNDILIDK